jgi:hypothetical protein
MAMGTKRARQKQEALLYASEQAEAPGHRSTSGSTLC